MTDKITLSREHVERLIERLSKAQMFKEVTELRAALADPVPPAGVDLVECDACPTSGGCVGKCMKAPAVEDVEVIAEVVNKYGDPEAFAERDLLQRTAIDKLKIGTELVDRAHVTRLQAEVTSANADKAAFAQNAVDLRLRVDALQSELTKALELLSEASISLRQDERPQQANDIDAFLSNQSAGGCKP